MMAKDSARFSNILIPTVTSRLKISPCSLNLQSAIFLCKAARDGLLFSMKTTRLAPRLRASIPSAPVPAKRSKTCCPWIRSCRMSKMASFTRSEVGRRLRPFAEKSLLPFNFPLITRNTFHSSMGTAKKNWLDCNMEEDVVKTQKNRIAHSVRKRQKE